MSDDTEDQFSLGNPMLGMLQSRGARVDEPLLVEHYFFCPDADAVKALAAEVAKVGLTVDEEHSDLTPSEEVSEGEYTLLCSETIRPDEADSRAALLNELAEKFESAYDGWGASV